METAASVYIHIPFCRHRCGYCDFNTYAGVSDRIPDYVQALCSEIQWVATALNARKPVGTVYFGGGTPSLLDAGQLERILEALRRYFDLAEKCEITLEANPGTVTRSFFESVRHSGINRVSLGMQSAIPEQLRFLERCHDPFDVIKAVEWARQAGIDNFSLDLIYGLPDQTLAQWERSLQLAVGLNPSHLSLYALSIESGTPLQRWIDHGLVAIPDDDQAADQFEFAWDYLTENRFYQYEISNWARKSGYGESWECRHNLQYWHNLEYLGFGAGAHGYANGWRYSNTCQIDPYIHAMIQPGHIEYPFSPAVDQRTRIDKWTEMQETMMVGLRLTREGISFGCFQERFGMALDEVFKIEINRLIQDKLLERTGPQGDILRLTRRGCLLGNRVFSEFVGD